LAGFSSSLDTVPPRLFIYATAVVLSILNSTERPVRLFVKSGLPELLLAAPEVDVHVLFC
jgi:hypothetical protein